MRTAHHTAREGDKIEMIKKITDELKSKYKEWSNTPYKNKCEDIGTWLSGIIFFVTVIIVIEMGYLDWFESVIKEQLTFSDEFIEGLTDDEKTRWLYIILGFTVGVTLFPLMIWYKISSYLGYGIMWLVYQYLKKYESSYFWGNKKE